MSKAIRGRASRSAVGRSSDVRLQQRPQRPIFARGDLVAGQVRSGLRVTFGHVIAAMANLHQRAQIRRAVDVSRAQEQVVATSVRAGGIIARRSAATLPARLFPPARSGSASPAAAPRPAQRSRDASTVRRERSLPAELWGLPGRRHPRPFRRPPQLVYNANEASERVVG
jgi:hypothetical protein